MRSEGSTYCGPDIDRHRRRFHTAVQGSIIQLIDTLDTRVESTHLTPDLGVTSKYLLDIDRAKLPLDGVSPVVS